MYVLIIIISSLPTSVTFVEWIGGPNNWLFYSHILWSLFCRKLTYYDINTGCLFVCLFFNLFFYSLVDDKNSKEGQITFLWTNFIRKSYENPFTVRGELTPTSTQHTNRAELLEGQQLLSGLQKTNPMLLPPSFNQGEQLRERSSQEWYTGDCTCRCLRWRATCRIRKTCIH